MDEWINEWMHVLNCKTIRQWMNERFDKWNMNELIIGHMNEIMNEWTDERINEWSNEWIYDRSYEWHLQWKLNYLEMDNKSMFIQTKKLEMYFGFI